MGRGEGEPGTNIVVEGVKTFEGLINSSSLSEADGDRRMVLSFYSLSESESKITMPLIQWKVDIGLEGNK